MTKPRNIGLNRRRTQIVEAGAGCTRGNVYYMLLQSGEDGNAVLLPRNTEPDTGGNGLGEIGMQKGGKRFVQLNTMRARYRADGDWIGCPFRQPTEHIVRPGLRSREKSLPEQDGFLMSFARAGKGCGKFGKLGKVGRVTMAAMTFGKEHRIVPYGAIAGQRLQPTPQHAGIFDEPVGYGPLKTARIGE